MHKETVTPELLHVLTKLNSIPTLNPFRLVGGTAIALQLGHRQSLDIDLFSNERINWLDLKQALNSAFPDTELSFTEHSALAEIQNIRVEIYDDWSIPFRKEPILKEGLRLAALEDLAAFKLSAITSRREKKDYIDLFFLFEKLDATNLLKQFKLYEPLLSPKSLLFALSEVKEAQKNKSPMPHMLVDVSWAEIEKRIIQVTKEYISLVENSSK